MAKIRTLKRKLSILIKTDKRAIKKYKQRGGLNQKISTKEQIKFGADRLVSFLKYTRIRNKLKSIINQKT